MGVRLTQITTVNVYDHAGYLADALQIADNLSYVDGRVSIGSKGYYKGVGMPYNGHYLAPDTSLTDDLELVERSDVFYVGDFVVSKTLEGKTGIFRLQYQPQFEDFVGTCGVKELALIEHSTEFERSSVELIKSFQHDAINKQYYFLLNYRCGRIPFLEAGTPSALIELLDCMVATGWNFIWDKNSIDDISYDGRVTDVADIFRSRELRHQLGTVYSALYSLHSADPAMHHETLTKLGLVHRHQMDHVLNAARVLSKFDNNSDAAELLKRHAASPKTLYALLIKTHLVEGKNCGDCSFVGLGDAIREKYRVQVSSI
jgi:hypothetical protein